MLYNNALRDYNSGKYDLVVAGVRATISSTTRNTDLAGNAQFYLADIEYRQGNFEAGGQRTTTRCWSSIPAETKRQRRS